MRPLSASDHPYVYNFSRKLGYDIEQDCLKPRGEAKCTPNRGICDDQCWNMYANAGFDTLNNCYNQCSAEEWDCLTDVVQECDERFYELVRNYATGNNGDTGKGAGKLIEKESSTKFILFGGAALGSALFIFLKKFIKRG